MLPADPRRRLDVLARAARALHGEPDAGRLLRWAVYAAVDILGAPDTGICLLARDGSPVWQLAPEATAAMADLGDLRNLPVVAGVFDGRSVHIDDLHEAAAASPLLARTRAALGAGPLTVVPIAADDATAPIGAVVVLGLASPDPEALQAVAAVGAHLAIALENHQILAKLAELQARGEQVVHQLQEAVRPPAPAVDWTELGVEYVAADPSAPTGGDLYDWSTLADGDLHLAVVDVMGKGVEATKHALGITHALRLLALEGCPLDQIIAKADALVTAQNPDLVATLMVARYRPATGRLTLVGAGHPPALLVTGAGVEQVAAPGIPIGWPGAGSHEVVELQLERSDTLVLYTDGLIEATKNILSGLEQLVEAATATASYPARAMARALVDRQLADAVRRDDSLALVLRRRTPPELPSHPALAPLVHRFSPSSAAVPIARHLLRDWLKQVPVEDETVDALLLVASELCSNAVRHASGGPGGVTLRALVEGDAIALEVTDDGEGELVLPDRLGEHVPEPSAERGRGLFLVAELSDELVTRSEGGRCVIRAVKRAVVPEQRVAAGAATGPA